MATIRIQMDAAGTAREELQRVQREVVGINEQIARNRRALVDATGEQRNNLQETNRRLSAERGLLSAQRQRLNLALPGLRDEIRATREATTATRRLSGVFTEISGIVGGIGIAELAFGISQFATNSVRAAAELEGFQRGLKIIEGTSAPQRLQELIEVANLPGLQLAQLINYNNRLRAIGLTGDEVDKILLTTGQTILAMGGTSDTASQAVEQLTQALSKNTVSLQDFRAIASRIPGFYNAISEVHGVAANIDGFRVAVDNAGGSVKDALLPVMDELARRFGSPPADSYVVAVDALQNSFFLLQAGIGDKFLPVIAEAANQLASFFDSVTEFIDGNLFAAKSAEDFTQAISGTTASVKSLLPELDEYIRRLDQRAANPRGAISSQELEDLADAKDLYDLVSGALDGNTESISELETRTSAAKTALDAANTEQERLKAAIDAVDPSIRSERDSLQGLNADLSANAERISAAQSEYDQLNRVFTAVNEETETLRQSLTSLENPTQAAGASTRELSVAVNQIDTRFLSFHERASALSGAIRELPPAITAVRDGFDVLAPTAVRVNAIFDEMNTSLVNTQTELEGLDAATRQIIQDLQDLEGLAHVRAVIADRTDVHNANLINQAVSDAVESFRDYNDVLLEAGINFRSVEDISQDVTDAARDQASAFDDLRDDVESAEISLDDIDATMQEIDQTIEDDLLNSVSSLDIAFEDLGNALPGFLTDTLDLLAAVNSEFEGVANAVSNLVGAAASGDGIAFLANIPGLVDSLNELQTDPNLTTEARSDRAFDIIGQIQDSDLSASQQQELIAPIQEYIREILTRSILSAPEAISPALILQQESFARTRGLDFNFDRDRQALGLGDTGFQTPFDLPEIDLSGVIAQLTELERLGNSAKQRRGTGEETTTGTGGGAGTTARSTAQQPTLRALTDVQSAYIQSLGFDPSAYGYDSRRNAFVKTAQGNGPTLIYDDSEAFDAARTPQVTGSELGTPTAQPTAADPLGTFRLTGVEREDLVPYEQAVTRAEQAVEDLTADSTPQEIADAYEMLVFAQTNLSNVTAGIIREAERVGRITGTAATNAIMGLGLELGGDIRTANNELISSLGAVGYEVVGGIENIREAIDVSNISEVFRPIPQMIEDAVAPEQAQQIAEPPPELDDVFNFTGQQRGVLSPLQNEVKAAEEFIRDFITEDSTPEEIRAAYSRLTDAETALYNQQLMFINNATDITEEARGRAVRVAGQVFDAEIRDANQRVIGAFEDIGFELVNALTFTSGILAGAALAIQQIPQEVEAAAETEAEVDPNDPLAPLRSNVASARNRVGRARFDLGQSTSEQQFETRRLDLIAAINAEYEAQIILLGELGLTDEEVTNRSAALLLTRDQGLARATNATNEFYEARIKGEENAVDAAQRAARERMRITERQQREAERAAEMQIREEMRLLDDINDLRDDAIDNEADRLQAIENLNEESARRREDIEEDHQERLRDIQLRFLRSGEDIDREFGRDIEDILRDAGANTLLSPRELERFLRSAQSPHSDLLASEGNRLGADLSEEDISQIQDLARERLRDRQDIDTRSQRQRADAQNRVQQARAEEAARSSVRRAEIQESAAATATAIETALTPLLEMQIGLSPETIAMQTETAALESMTAVMNSESAVMTNEASGRLLEVADEQETAVGMITLAAEELQSAARVQGLFDAAEALRGASGELSAAVSEFGGVIKGLEFLIGGFLATFENVNDAIGEGTLGIRPQMPAEPALLETSPENPLAVEVANTDDLYNPERIAELRGEGLNNREIGMILREGSAVMMPSDIESRMAQPASPMGFDVDSVSITAGSVTVSGATVSGDGDPVNVDVNVQNSDVNLDGQKVGQMLGDVSTRQGQQGRNLATNRR